MIQLLNMVYKMIQLLNTHLVNPKIKNPVVFYIQMHIYMNANKFELLETSVLFIQLE